jgi:hypothetical protein
VTQIAKLLRLVKRTILVLKKYVSLALIVDPVYV